jgi:integrase
VSGNEQPRQLSFFPPEPDRAAGRARKPQCLDPQSEATLSAFADYRLAQGAAPATARSEIGQLRSLCHAVGTSSRPVPLTNLLAATDALAAALAGLASVVGLSTNQLRLRALGRFAQFCEDYLGIPCDRQLDLLYQRLPARRPPNWHHTGVVVGGMRDRRTRLGRTMLAQDLAAVAAARPTGSGYREVRDRALLALACHTGLRIAELAARGRRTFGPAYTPGPGGAGPVFRDPATSCALTERQVFAVVKRALTAAGFPRAGQTDLRRALLHYLRGQGLSDHEAMVATGIKDARTFDRLMERVRRLLAQRVIQEHQAGEGDDATIRAAARREVSDPDAWPPG